LDLRFGKIFVKVFQTPGHTKGGVSFLVGKNFLSGDNLINYKIGRSDLPGGNPAELLDTLKVILEMPDDITILPGHGDSMPLASAKLIMKKYFL
jgi:glyoxylase-like metal-dependent hydrolase (beta-lactamase superfamily II)